MTSNTDDPKLTHPRAGLKTHTHLRDELLVSNSIEELRRVVQQLAVTAA